jgi:hypothetical protein
VAPPARGGKETSLRREGDSLHGGRRRGGLGLRRSANRAKAPVGVAVFTSTVD